MTAAATASAATTNAATATTNGATARTNAATTSAATASDRLWDVMVIGAGPAGALISRQAAVNGRSVLLVDRSTFPRDKVCGGCLSARTLAAMDAAGLGRVVAALGGREVRRLRLGGWSRAAELSLPVGLSISRRAMDAALVAEAVEAGADFLPAHSAAIGAADADRRHAVLRSAGARHDVAARIVIDASGLGSRLLARQQRDPAPAAGSGTVRVGSRIGCSATIDAPVPGYRPGTIFMAVGKEGYVGVVRLEAGLLNVAAALDPRAVRQEGLAETAQRILQGAGFDPVEGLARARWAGTPRLDQRPPRLAAERVFSAGDAAGYVEPFTGEGIGWAVRSAVSLGPILERALERWSDDLVGVWSHVHRRELARSQRACRALAWLLRRPPLVRAVIRTLERRPALGAPFVQLLHAAPVDEGRPA